MSAMLSHEVRLFVGKRGSGKSYAAKKLCAEQLAAKQRVCAFDPHDEYSQVGTPSEAVNLGPLREHVAAAHLLENPELLDAADLSLAIVPSGKPAEVAEDFASVADLVLATGRCVFVVDEVGDYARHAEEELIHVATQSRHSLVPVVFVAQRMTQIPKTARDQASHLASGIQSDPDDLKALAKLTGDKDFAARVSRLPRRKLLEWRDAQ